MFVSSAYICVMFKGDNDQSYNKVVHYLVQIIGAEDKKLFFVFSASVKFIRNIRVTSWSRILSPAM